MPKIRQLAHFVAMKFLLVIRGTLLTIWFLLHTLICAVTLLVGAFIFPSRWWCNLVIHTLWSRPVLWLSGIQVTERGHELWPDGQGCLVLFNHTSWMDIAVLSSHLPRIPRFGAKIELFKVPFFGRAMKRAGMLPIERHNRTKVLQIYKDAEQRAKNGECFALAPEGTRQAELSLGKFKQGPFLFAIGAQMPIVPVVIAGARETMPKGSWLINTKSWRTPVVVQVLSPVQTKGMSDKEIAALQDSIRASMASHYEILNRELGLS